MKPLFLVSLLIITLAFSTINTKDAAAAKTTDTKKADTATQTTTTAADPNKKEDPANPNEELKEKGLKCLLDILDKIENDKSDGKFKGDLKNDGKRTDTIKLNQLFKVGVDQGIDITTLLLQYFNLESKDIKVADGEKNFTINLRKAITNCNLNMDKALKRCEYAYSKLKGAECERVRWGGNEEWGTLFILLKL